MMNDPCQVFFQVSVALIGTFFLLRGIIPLVETQSWAQDDVVAVDMGLLTSTNLYLPKDYNELPFCRSEGKPIARSHDWGQVLSGKRTQLSGYSVSIKQDLFCQELCKTNLDHIKANRLKAAIFEGYRHNWIVDGMPAAYQGLHPETRDLRRWHGGGFPIGYISPDGSYHVYNHLNIIVGYTPVSVIGQADKYRIVSFAVEPLSVMHEVETRSTLCIDHTHLAREKIQNNQHVEENIEIRYTYDVIWQEASQEWPSHWKHYHAEADVANFGFSWFIVLGNSAVWIAALALFFAHNTQYIKRDLAILLDKSKDISIEESDTLLMDDQETGYCTEKGCRAQRADIFRPPEKYPMLFCVFIATGVQITCTLVIVSSLSSFGVISTSRTGSSVIGGLTAYCLCGFLAGYVSSRLFAGMFQRTSLQDRRRCVAWIAGLFPGAFILLYLWWEALQYRNLSPLSLRSSAAMLVILLALFNTVMVYLGDCYGHTKDPFPKARDISSWERESITKKRLLRHQAILTLFTGAFILQMVLESYLVNMTIGWLGYPQSMVRCTGWQLAYLVFHCILVSSAVVYGEVNRSNHRWWWVSFFASGTVGLYVFLYSIVFYRNIHEPDDGSGMFYACFYFGCMVLISFGTMLVTGSAGALSSLILLRQLYRLDSHEQ